MAPPQCKLVGKTLTCKLGANLAGKKKLEINGRLLFLILTSVIILLFFSNLLKLVGGLFTNTLVTVLVTGGILLLLVRLGWLDVSRVLKRFGI